jgi:RNA polymerase sigma-70 factor, ECF subfamily
MGVMDEEKAWISRSQNGDQAAFESLIRAHQRMIHSLTYRMTGSLADAEDLAQETFVRAYHQLDGFRSESKFSTWLCRIAVNACINWHRRENRRGAIHRQWAGEKLQSELQGSSDSEINAASQTVQNAFNRLPPKLRAAIVLTVYDELTHAEAAKVLGCAEATVSWRVFAARRKLRRWLASTGGGR